MTKEPVPMNLSVDPPGAAPAADTETGFRASIDAGAKTASLLSDCGLDLDVDDEDMQVAGTLVRSYAADEDKVNKTVTSGKIATLTPASLLITKRILDEYSHAVVQDSVQIRHMVTNKLIEEVDNPDPRVRLKALELLGKISDVGLFSEKREVTVTHQNSDDLRAKLREKLQALRDVTPAEEADYDIVEVLE